MGCVRIALICSSMLEEQMQCFITYLSLGDSSVDFKTCSWVSRNKPTQTRKSFSRAIENVDQEKYLLRQVIV